MTSFAELLGPSDPWLAKLKAGAVTLARESNRVRDTDTGQYLARLVPTNGASEALARLPLQPQLAAQAIAQSGELSAIAPAVEALQLAASVGAIASVANLGVSCGGFAIVIRRLGRIEGKLDQMLGEIEALKAAVSDVHAHQDALSIARLRSAAECLQRSLAADNETTRKELASRARNLFQESRLLYLELWRRAAPWHQAAVPIPTALELHARCVACALGEIQAEFVIGDLGAFRSATETTSAAIAEVTGFSPRDVYRIRSDEACRGHMSSMPAFQARADMLTEELANAWRVADWTVKKLAAFEADVDLVESTGLPPYQVVRELQALPGIAYLALPLERRKKKWWRF